MVILQSRCLIKAKSILNMLSYLVLDVFGMLCAKVILQSRCLIMAKFILNMISYLVLDMFGMVYKDNVSK